MCVFAEIYTYFTNYSLSQMLVKNSSILVSRIPRKNMPNQIISEGCDQMISHFMIVQAIVSFSLENNVTMCT